ncbi:MAG TPA: FlgD immunoglobulin-like domain containing protein [Candidatus Krumholzibacteria bacterium]|nr:FlgD immunoglobulin-like domain containing protein [Candidatus Krumholzibacteria bacterium]
MPPSVRRGVCSALILIAAACSEAAHAKPVRLHLFNLNPDHTYRFRIDGADVASLFSGPTGSAAVGVDAAVGSVLSIVDEGSPDLQPPPPPLFTSLDSNDPGCARADWVPSGDPTVTGYLISFGARSVAGGEATQYEHTVEVTAASFLQVCSLEKGTHYFAVRSRNYAGMLSAYSAERSVQIVVVSVLIAGFDARVVGESVALSWKVDADEPILGFRVYRTGPDRVERLLTPDLIAPGEDSFLDGDVRAATSYSYQAAAVSENGDETRSFPLSVRTPARTLALDQNVPNPFNPATTIPFVLAETSRVLLRVYDVRGAHVATLCDGVLPGGRHSIGWDGRNDGGRAVSSGTYLYSLVAGKHRLSRKMLMVR